MIQDCCKVRTPPSGQNAAWGKTGSASQLRAEHPGSCSPAVLMGGAGPWGVVTRRFSGRGGRELPSSRDYESRAAPRRAAQAR